MKCHKSCAHVDGIQLLPTLQLMLDFGEVANKVASVEDLFEAMPSVQLEGIMCIIIALFTHFAKAVQQMYEYHTTNTIREVTPGENYVEFSRLMLLLTSFLTLSMQVFDSSRYKTETQVMSSMPDNKNLLKTLPKFRMGKYSIGCATRVPDSHNVVMTAEMKHARDQLLPYKSKVLVKQDVTQILVRIRDKVRSSEGLNVPSQESLMNEFHSDTKIEL